MDQREPAVSDYVSSLINSSITYLGPLQPRQPSALLWGVTYQVPAVDRKKLNQMPSNLSPLSDIDQCTIVYWRVRARTDPVRARA